MRKAGVPRYSSPRIRLPTKSSISTASWCTTSSSSPCPRTRSPSNPCGTSWLSGIPGNCRKATGFSNRVIGPVMPTANIVREIQRFNRGRDPRRLQLKYQAMRESAFAFMRGTCHLFYAGLPAVAALQRAPDAWISGDLHMENFGAYKGDNRLVYFDLNDFDEACLAPCTWEPLRMLASISLAGDKLGTSEREAL